jgi:hypothetical protein
MVTMTTVLHTAASITAAATAGNYQLIDRAGYVAIVDGGRVIATVGTAKNLALKVKGYAGVDAHVAYAKTLPTAKSPSNYAGAVTVRGVDAQLLADMIVPMLETGTLARGATPKAPKAEIVLGLDALIDALVPTATDEDVALVELIEALAA